MSKVFADSSDPIIIEDLAGNIINMNDEAERVYGWTREELLGRPINTIIPAEHHRGADELWSRVKQGEQVRNVERLRHNKSGNVFPILTDEKGNPAGMATIAKDLSDVKEMEERLVCSEKLAVLGQLAGGVGHELHNPLGVIKNAAYFLNMVLEEPEPEVKETLELPEGGRLVVKSEVVPAEWLVVSFTDTGVGIPEENWERVFELLFTTKAKGIGLRLALSRILVEADGGTIEVESEVDKGSTFTVRLPIRRDEEQ